MSDQPAVQLLLYKFGPGASFDGALVGALERVESGGAVRILDALFLHADADSGELVAVNLRGDGAGGIVAPLLDFRLSSESRQRATERVLSDRDTGIPGDLAIELGRTLERGAASAAVLVDHAWLRGVQDAVARTAGVQLASQFVEAATFAELAPSLLAATGSTDADGVARDP